MELSKKTTILFSPEQHEQLARLAEQRSSSIGELVRDACTEVHGFSMPEDRRNAVAEISRLSLPVSDVATMKRQSVETEE